MHKRQGWKEKTPEGDRREVRATHHGPKWRFQSRLKGEEAWIEHDPPLRADVESLYDLMQRKYRRRRCSLKEVEDVARILEKLS